MGQIYFIGRGIVWETKSDSGEKTGDYGVSHVKLQNSCYESK